MAYRTVVVDPPWPYPEGWGRTPGGNMVPLAVRRGEAPVFHDRKPLPYKAMPLGQIMALPIDKLADPKGCHIYL